MTTCTISLWANTNTADREAIYILYVHTVQNETVTHNIVTMAMASPESNH